MIDKFQTWMGMRGFFVPREVLENKMIDYVGFSAFGRKDDIEIS